MQEISLNILDIVQNSIKAKAKIIIIEIKEHLSDNLLTVTISDDGCGMTEEQLKTVTDPFYTTRETRNVGLGIPFFKMSAELTGGSFDIKSKPGAGTVLCAKFVYNSFNRMPLGNMSETIGLLIQCNPNIDFIYRHEYEEKVFILDTRKIKEILQGVAIDKAEVILSLRSYIDEQYSSIKQSSKKL